MANSPSLNHSLEKLLALAAGYPSGLARENPQTPKALIPERGNLLLFLTAYLQTIHPLNTKKHQVNHFLIALKLSLLPQAFARVNAIF